MIFCLFFRKEDNLLGWKSILCDDDHDHDHDHDQDHDRHVTVTATATVTLPMIIISFFHPKGPQIGLAPGGGADKL